MIFHRLKSLNKNQRGFTLIELIVTIAVTALIVGAVVMSIFQVVAGNALSSNHMKAVRQVQNAGYWVSHDTKMTQHEPVVVNDGGGQLESITLAWTEWESTTYNEVTYTLEGDELKRSHWVNGGGPSEIVVAQFINPASTKTSCEFTGGVLTLKVTADVGIWPQVESETRVYEIIPRPQ